MLAKNFLQSGRLNSIQNQKKTSLNKQRVALLHTRASKPDNSDKNAKDSEELGPNVTLKVIPELLNDQSAAGVGVIATVGVIAAAKLAKASYDGVAAAVEKDLKPALENPENFKNFKENISSAVNDATSNARKSMEQVGANFNEAMAELKASTHAANEKLAKEAELGASNWEKTKSAIILPGDSTSPSDKKDIVAKLTEVEDKGAEMLKAVGKEIKDMTVNRKESLQTGWLSKAVEKVEVSTTTSDAPAFSPTSEVVIETPVVVVAATPTAIAPPAPTPAAEQVTNESSIKKEETKEEPPSTIIPATTVAAATETKKKRDSSLDAATKNSRHISMLSAPMGQKSANNANNSALGYSKSSSSSSSSGGSSSSSSSGSSPAGASTGGSSGTSARAGLDALKAAAGAGAVAAAAATAVVASGGGDVGGSGGGGSGGGGDGNSGDDGNKNNLYLLLLALALTGVGCYLSQQQAKKKSAATN